MQAGTVLATGRTTAREEGQSPSPSPSPSGKLVQWPNAMVALQSTLPGAKSPRQMLLLLQNRSQACCCCCRTPRVLTQKKCLHAMHDKAMWNSAWCPELSCAAQF